jgi:YVTN family beta-propeller protein
MRRRRRALWQLSSFIVAGFMALASLGHGASAHEVLVVSQTAAELSIIDTTTDTITHRIKLDATPAGVAVSPDGKRAYVTHPELRRLSVIDLIARSVVATLPVGRQPFAVTVDTRGDVWVGDWSADVVQRIDAETGAVKRTIAVGRSPSAILLGAGEANLYAVNRESDDVSVADPVTGEELRRIPVGRAPFAIAASADHQRLFVVNVQASTVSIVDLKTLRSDARIEVGRMPYGVAVDTETGRVLVTNQQSASVSIIDADEAKVVGTVPVGQFPEGIVVVPGTGKAYVANWFSDQVSVIDVRSGTEIKRLSCAAGPRMLAVSRNSAS